MVLATLLFGGGLLFWAGLLSGQRVLLFGGGALLGALFAWMVELGSIHPAVLLALVGIAALVWALSMNRFPTLTGRVLGWLAYVSIVLLLGFHQFPGLVPVPLLETDSGVLRFPPEKIILLGIVPPLVWTPIELNQWRWGIERPGRTFAVLLLVTLLVLIPLALLLAQVRPGWTSLPLPALAYGLAYNLVFVCVLEESFFRGIAQTALMRWARQRRWPHADGLGLLGASLLFGLVHLKGGMAFALLAILAGLGYGLVYYMTGRIHYAVLLHFAVNAVHQLAFAAPPMIS
jgi:membrane protease YdiL (CAAX protease family)